VFFHNLEPDRARAGVWDGSFPAEGFFQFYEKAD
jgi:hypothetical protein